jgi:F0F1-type ATP synthase epsilon subunit
MAVDTTGNGSTYGAAQAAKATKPGQKRLKVRVISPYQTRYDGEAVSVSASNRTGPFDILPGHINFFALLTGGTVTLNTGFQVLEFPIARGIVRVTNDQVTLFVDI